MIDETSAAGGADRLDLEARWALVAPHRDHLLAVAQRRCPTTADAEDCVHEAMVRTVAYPPLDPDRVGALVTAMVVRVAADHARRRGAELRGRARLATVPEQEAAPGEALADGDEARWLAEQVQRLPERERQVFEHRAAGLTATQTASVLQLSYKAVESAFTRARSRLRLWAVTAALLAGALHRRLRQRPAALTAVLAFSAGCLLASGPLSSSAPRHAPVPGAGFHGMFAGVGPVRSDAARTAAARPGTAGLTPSRSSSRRPAATASSGSGSKTSPTLSFRTGPVNSPTGGPPLTDGLGLDSDLSGDPVYHYEYCLSHPMLGPSVYGCPQT